MTTNDDRERLLEMIASASRRGEFVLTSGARSDFYVDGKLVTLDPEGLERKYTMKLNPDLVVVKILVIFFLTFFLA